MDEELIPDEIDWFQVEIIWHGPVPTLPNINDLVRLDCTKNLNGLECVGDLLFHTIFLTNSQDKEIVIAWGEGEDDNNLHCEYHPIANWQSLADIDLLK